METLRQLQRYLEVAYLPGSVSSLPENITTDVVMDPVIFHVSKRMRP